MIGPPGALARLSSPRLLTPRRLMPLLLRLVVLFSLAGCALAGCASSSSSQPGSADAAEADLRAARQAVERARGVGAEAEAPAEFRAATSRLLQAEAALEDGEDGRAARLAREATIDGKLAEVAVLASRARRRAQLAADVDSLRANL